MEYKERREREKEKVKKMYSFLTQGYNLVHVKFTDSKYIDVGIDEIYFFYSDDDIKKRISYRDCKKYFGEYFNNSNIFDIESKLLDDYPFLKKKYNKNDIISIHSFTLKPNIFQKQLLLDIIEKL